MKWLALVAGTVLAGAVVCAETPSAYAQSPSSSSSSAAPKKVSAKKKKTRHSRREPKQKAPTPDRIEEIQSALASDGYYPGTPNGKWDSTTVAALQKFQTDHGLDATGKLDALSLQKLGLGSEIAGVSAPRPVRPAPQNAAPPGTPPVTPKPQAPKPSDAPSVTPIASTTPPASVPTGTSASAIAAPKPADAKPATPPQPQ